MRISCQEHLKTSGEPRRIAPPRRIVLFGPLTAPIAFHPGPSFVRQQDRLACIAPGLCACYAKTLRTLRKWYGKAHMSQQFASRPLVIAPSILASDFAKLGEEVRAVDAAGPHLSPHHGVEGRLLPNISY